jgi:hypothetical protein
MKKYRRTKPGSEAGISFRYKLVRQWIGDGFHRNPARLLELLPAMNQDFSAWNSFQRIPLHEVK